MANKLILLALSVSLAIAAAVLVSSQLIIAQASLSSTSATSEREFYKLSGKGAWADWYLEEDGVYTNVYLLISDRTFRTHSANTPAAIVEASVYQYRYEEICEEEEYGEEYCYYQEVPIYSFYGEDELSKSDFMISNSFTSASITAELTGYGYNSGDEDQTIYVNATWTGYGETFKGRDRYSINNDFERVTESSTGFFKQAIADISINGEGIALHLDDNSEGQAYISKFKNAYFERITYEE